MITGGVLPPPGNTMFDKKVYLETKGDDLRKGRLKDPRKWQRVLDTANRYTRAPLYVDDSSDIGMLEVRAKARRLHNLTQPEGGLGLIIIDYLQLVKADGWFVWLDACDDDWLLGRRAGGTIQCIGHVMQGINERGLIPCAGPCRFCVRCGGVI